MTFRQQVTRAQLVFQVHKVLMIRNRSEMPNIAIFHCCCVGYRGAKGEPGPKGNYQTIV